MSDIKRKQGDVCFDCGHATGVGATRCNAKQMLKDAIWKAILVQGQDTTDRVYKSVMAQFRMSDQEIRDFEDALYQAEIERDAPTRHD